MKLKLLTVGILVIMVLTSFSCGVKAAQQTITTTITPALTPTTTGEYQPPDDVDWLSPGKVNIANFRPGATAEYPITVHNGSDGVTVEVKQVTTDPGETVADIPIKRALAFTDRLNDIKLTSDNTKDKLSVTDSEVGYLTISGFTPAESRKLTIEYIALTEFKVYYRVPNRVGVDYVSATEAQQEWILVADMTPVFLPKETKDVLITLYMPAGAAAPGEKWEFWVGVTRSGQGTVQTELISRWQVSMRK